MGKWWKRAPEQWHSGELLLACGATAVADLRAAVAAELNYSCSAGIAHNKVFSAAFCPFTPGCVCICALSGSICTIMSGRIAQRRAMLHGPGLRRLDHVEHHLQCSRCNKAQVTAI